MNLAAISTQQKGLPRLVLTRLEAAQVLRIGKSKLAMLVAEGKVRPTAYGTYPIAELERHLREEMEEAACR